MRGQRDSIQHEMSLLTAKSTIKFDQIQEVRTIANSRWDRIKALESANTRLISQIAAGMGDMELLRFFDENSEAVTKADEIEHADVVGGKASTTNPFTYFKQRARYNL